MFFKGVAEDAYSPLQEKHLVAILSEPYNCDRFGSYLRDLLEQHTRQAVRLEDWKADDEGNLRLRAYDRQTGTTLFTLINPQNGPNRRKNDFFVITKEDDRFFGQIKDVLEGQTHTYIMRKTDKKASPQNYFLTCKHDGLAKAVDLHLAGYCVLNKIETLDDQLAYRIKYNSDGYVFDPGAAYGVLALNDDHYRSILAAVPWQTTTIGERKSPREKRAFWTVLDWQPPEIHKTHEELREMHVIPYRAPSEKALDDLLDHAGFVGIKEDRIVPPDARLSFLERGIVNEASYVTAYFRKE